MRLRITIVALLAMAMLASAAIAQKKMYKWTDADGNVHYSDSVPPTDINQPRDEFNQHGRVVEHTGRALTPAEIKIKEAEEEAARLEEIRKEKQLKEDRKLLAIYAEEIDITRSKDQQISVIDRSIETGQAIVDGQTRSLAGLMDRAAQLEGQGQPVNDALKSSISQMQRQINMQKAYVRRMELEKIATTKRFAQELERYRDVRKRWGLSPESSR